MIINNYQNLSGATVGDLMKIYKKQMPQAAANLGNPRKNPLIKCKGRIMDNWTSKDDLGYRSMAAGVGAPNSVQQFNNEREKALKTKTLQQPLTYSSFSSGREIGKNAQPNTNKAGFSEGSSHIVGQFLGNIPFSNYDHRSDISQHKNSTENVVQAVININKDSNEGVSSGDQTQGTSLKKNSTPSSNDAVPSAQAFGTPHTTNLDNPKTGANRSKTPQLRQRLVTSGPGQVLAPKLTAGQPIISRSGNTSPQ